MLKLYTFFRSSAAYRVRIALNLKNLPYESIPIHLLKNGGEQNSPGYRKTNPHGLVPALQIEDGLVLTQSLAIIEYLEEAYPKSGHPLLPESIPARARVRALAQAIACDIHPLNKKEVGQRLSLQAQGRSKKTPGTDTGSPRACRPLKPNWLAAAIPASFVTAMRPAWRTAAWFRKWPMPRGLTARWTIFLP